MALPAVPPPPGPSPASTAVAARGAATPSRAGLVAAERWAEAVKAQAIYPPGHHRVATALDALLHALEDARAELQLGSDVPQDAEGALQVVFADGGVLVNGVRSDVDPTGPLAWLRTRLNQGALAGVVFLREATRADLDALGRRLLEIHSLKGARSDPEALWSGTWSGVRLLNRRFEGLFAGTQSDARRAQRTWGGLGGPLEAGQRARMAETLRSDPTIRERLTLIRRRMEAEGLPPTGPESERGMELLQRLAGMLPAATANDPARARTVATGLLDALEQRLEEQGGAEGLNGFFSDPALERRVVFLCTTLFQSAGGAHAAGAESARAERDQGRERGHAGDEQVTEDLASFHLELDRLGPPVPVPVGELESPAEQLGVLLHLLVHDAAPERLPGLARALARLTPTADSPLQGVLRRVLEALALRADGPGEAPALQRLLTSLREAGGLPLLRAAGWLGPERVRESFPTDFVLYVDALDLAREGDADELVRVLAEVGPERLAAAAPVLTAPGGLLAPERAEALLRVRRPGLAPLVRVLSERGGATLRPAVIGWLRALALREPEGRALDLLDDPASVPSAYVDLLLDLLQGRPPSPSGQALVASLLARFLRRTAGQATRTARRLEALQLLGTFAVPEAHQALCEVAYARRWLVVPREPRPLRLAARRALAARGAA